MEQSLRHGVQSCMDSICNHFISESNFKRGTLVTLVVPGFWIVLFLFKVNFNSRKIPLLLNFPRGSAVRVFVSDLQSTLMKIL